jgi:hypothetical protein
MDTAQRRKKGVMAMTQVVVDPALRAKLNGLADKVELLDESGETLAYCLPAAEYNRLLYASVKIPFTDEEIERRLQEKGGRSLAEILADFEKQ